MSHLDDVQPLPSTDSLQTINLLQMDLIKLSLIVAVGFQRMGLEQMGRLLALQLVLIPLELLTTAPDASAQGLKSENCLICSDLSIFYRLFSVYDPKKCQSLQITFSTTKRVNLQLWGHNEVSLSRDMGKPTSVKTKSISSKNSFLTTTDVNNSFLH